MTDNRHVIHTTLIVFYDLISKSDATVTECDFSVNPVVSIFACCHPSHYSSVAKAKGLKVVGFEAWWFKTSCGSTFFPVYDKITLT